MKKVLGNIFRFLMIAISAVMLGCFVETMFSNMVNIGNIVGCALCLWIICVCIKPLHQKIRDSLKKTKFTSFIYRFVSFLFMRLLLCQRIHQAAAGNHLLDERRKRLRG